MAPIPALLAVAGLHHHLIRNKTRTRTGLLLESGEPREPHHFSLLIGHGVGAINPYLAFETLDDMIRDGMLPDIEHEVAVNPFSGEKLSGAGHAPLVYVQDPRTDMPGELQQHLVQAIAGSDEVIVAGWLHYGSAEAAPGATA